MKGVISKSLLNSFSRGSKPYSSLSGLLILLIIQPIKRLFFIPPKVSALTSKRSSNSSALSLSGAATSTISAVSACEKSLFILPA
jgi:hypothetical protein